jgi:hypothetical protein
MDERAATAASALTDGLGSVETNLKSAMGTQDDAPSLSDIESTVSTALDDKVGVPEHLDEQTQLVIPATGLYALTNGAQGGTDILSNPWLALAIANYLTPHIMETLLNNIELPEDWADAVTSYMHRSILAHWTRYSPEQIQGLWTRRAPTYTQDIISHSVLVRGITDRGSPFVVAVQIVGDPNYPPHTQVWYTLMNDTNPEKAYGDSDDQDQSIMKKANDLITQAVTTASRIDELVMVPRWTTGNWEDKSQHPTDLEMPNPFDEDGNHDTYEEARQQASEIIHLIQDATDRPDYYGSKFLQYLDPSVTEPWITLPAE